jgi:hypothetical protein
MAPPHVAAFQKFNTVSFVLKYSGIDLVEIFHKVVGPAT